MVSNHYEGLVEKKKKKSTNNLKKSTFTKEYSFFDDSYRMT